LKENIAECGSSDIHCEAAERLAAKNSSVYIGAITSDLKAVDIAFHKTPFQKVFHVSNT